MEHLGTPIIKSTIVAVRLVALGTLSGRVLYLLRLVQMAEAQFVSHRRSVVSGA
jgi:hypothetical protein